MSNKTAENKPPKGAERCNDLRRDRCGCLRDECDPSDCKPLPPVLKTAVTEFNDWSNAYLLAAEARNKVASPLYHYTDAAGLEGIVKNQQVWFTSYTHLNDPTEIKYGMSIASELLSEIGQGSDPESRCSATW